MTGTECGCPTTRKSCTWWGAPRLHPPSPRFVKCTKLSPPRSRTNSSLSTRNTIYPGHGITSCATCAGIISASPRPLTPRWCHRSRGHSVAARFRHGIRSTMVVQFVQTIGAAREQLMDAAHMRQRPALSRHPVRSRLPVRPAPPKSSIPWRSASTTPSSKCNERSTCTTQSR